MSRAEDTRRRLLDQARIAFAENGHDGVSLQRDVLGPAGVSNGSFYHQFSDKTDLLVAVLDDAANDRQFTLTGAADAPVDPQTVASRTFGAWFDLVDDAEDLFRIQVRERSNPDARVRDQIVALRRRWTSSIAEFLRHRRVSDVDADVAARLLAALAYGVLVDYLETPPSRRAAFRAEMGDAVPRFALLGVAGLSTTPTTSN